MAKRPCLVCGVLTSGSRCPTHTRRNTNAETVRRRTTVQAHRAQHGDWCPGWRRPSHPATDLTADHITPVAAGGAEAGPLDVLCRSCNSAKRDSID